MDFNTLNNNLNEYNLVRECIKFVGKETIEEQYERIKDKLQYKEIYKTEYFSYEFLKKYCYEIYDYYFIVNLDYQIKKSGMNKKDYIEKYKSILNYIFDESWETCYICYKMESDYYCEICDRGYCEDCIELTDCIEIIDDSDESTEDSCCNCDISNFELYMKYN
jgi:hypothetical protein